MNCKLIESPLHMAGVSFEYHLNHYEIPNLSSHASAGIPSIVVDDAKILIGPQSDRRAIIL